jgi:hypothetical protein
MERNCAPAENICFNEERLVVGFPKMLGWLPLLLARLNLLYYILIAVSYNVATTKL